MGPQLGPLGPQLGPQGHNSFLSEYLSRKAMEPQLGPLGERDRIKGFFFQFKLIIICKKRTLACFVCDLIRLDGQKTLKSSVS